MAFEDLVEQLARLRSTIPSNETSDAANTQLDTVNQVFVDLVNEWSLMTPTDRAERTKSYVQAQFDFNFISGQWLRIVRPPTEDEQTISDDQSAIDQNDGASKVTNPSEQIARIPSAPPVHEPMQVVEPTPMCDISYDDLVRILDPVHSLQRIEYVDENAIHDVLNCITETMTRARELNVLVPVEVHRSIVAYIHSLLDVTSQSMLSWRFSDMEASIASLIDWLRVRAQRIIPMERAPPSFAPNRAPAFIPNRASPASHRATPVASTSSGPTNTKRSKRVCPQCQGNHNLIRCQQFTCQSNTNRRLMVSQLALCENCLLPNHNAPDCAQGACHRCGEKHNSLLPCATDNA